MAPKMPPEFQGIMAFFVLWKVIRHFFDNEWVPIVSKGYLGEDFLFILNGFIFALASLEVKNNLTLKTYINHISKVLVHIYPLLLISELSIYFYFNHIGQENQCTLKDMFDHLTFTQVWSNPNTCNSLSWALAVEWVGYAIFPFLHALLKNKKTWHYALCAFAAYMTLFFVVHHYDWIHINKIYGGEVMIRFLTQSIIGFCLGNIYTLNKKGAFVYDILTIACISLTLQFSQTTASNDIYLVIFISALPYCLIKSLYQKQLFSLGPIKKVGEISITVLLTHGLVAEYAHHHHWKLTASNFFLYLWLCYIQGYLIHRFFEIPIDKIVHKITSFGANDYPYEPNGEVRHDEAVPGLAEPQVQNMAASEIIRPAGSANNSLGKEKTD